jgi:O-acetyl-ADP-ribose deacetylase
MSRLSVVEADITKLNVDIIVNAANEEMLGGGGVDGAIHRAAGTGLAAACFAFPEADPGVRCPTGQARITPSFKLPSKFIIHTVGPVWHGGKNGEARLLASCYSNSLRLAELHGMVSSLISGEPTKLTSIAIPAISTGIFGYPVEEACEIAVNQCLQANNLDVILVTFMSPEVSDCFKKMGY